MKIRIGKDLNIRWSILTNNEPTPLEGRNLNLLIQDPNRQQRSLSFTTEGNTIISYIPAADLTRLGDYILTLKENEGEEGQTVVDAKPAFTLVEYSTEESSEPTDPSLSVADITLSTGNLAYGITIEDVFSGEDGGTIQEGDIVPVLRDGILTRASQAAISAPGSEGEMVYKGVIHKAVPAQPRAGYAYVFRGSNFIPVFRMDDINNLSTYVSYFSGQSIFKEIRTEEPYYNPKYEVFAMKASGASPISINYGHIFESDEETKRVQDEVLDVCAMYGDLLQYFFIRVFSSRSFEHDLVVCIENEGHNTFWTRIGSIENHNIRMESNRFFIENGKVYCKEIPRILSMFNDEEIGSFLYIPKRVNVLRLKKKGHKSIRYNKWKVYSDKISYGITKSVKKYPIKLECGETSSFMRGRKKRGCSIHSIESNGRDIINKLGGG